MPPKPRSSSYTWRSILFGRDVLLRGIQWAIGDGRSMKITSDNWIPGCPAYMLKTTKEIPSIATVHCLMDEQTRKWIPETVYAFFDRETAGQLIR
jgi:hypothetical protein